MGDKSAKSELLQFTGLRGLAALLVLFYHVRTPKDLELHFGYFDAFSKFGYFGVDVFFVLSGFILSYVYGSVFVAGVTTSNLKSYGVARFARIYPLHVATLVLMLGAYEASRQLGVQPTEAGGYSWESTLLSLLLVQEWFGVVAPNPSSWSISIEFASYLLFPFFIGFILRIPRFWIFPFIIAAAITVDAMASLRMARSMIEFLMGCAAFTASRAYSSHKLGPLSAVVFVAPFIAADLIGNELPGFMALCFTLTVFCLYSEQSIDVFRYLCSSRLLVYFGTISYSVYLLQWFVWIGWKHVIARIPVFESHPYVMILCASATIIVASSVSYYCFESWARKRIRGIRGLIASTT
jgi:peptidoglycan/LPS O-acetylase OafA/YrhL